MHLVLMKHKHQIECRTIEDFSRLCEKGIIHEDTLIYDAEASEVVRVREVEWLRAAYNENKPFTISKELLSAVSPERSLEDLMKTPEPWMGDVEQNHSNKIESDLDEYKLKEQNAKQAAKQERNNTQKKYEDKLFSEQQFFDEMQETRAEDSLYDSIWNDVIEKNNRREKKRKSEKGFFKNRNQQRIHTEENPGLSEKNGISISEHEQNTMHNETPNTTNQYKSASYQQTTGLKQVTRKMIRRNKVRTNRENTTGQEGRKDVVFWQNEKKVVEGVELPDLKQFSQENAHMNLPPYLENLLNMQLKNSGLLDADPESERQTLRLREEFHKKELFGMDDARGYGQKEIPVAMRAQDQVSSMDLKGDRLGRKKVKRKANKKRIVFLTLSVFLFFLTGFIGKVWVDIKASETENIQQITTIAKAFEQDEYSGVNNGTQPEDGTVGVARAFFEEFDKKANAFQKQFFEEEIAGIETSSLFQNVETLQETRAELQMYLNELFELEGELQILKEKFFEDMDGRIVSGKEREWYVDTGKPALDRSVEKRMNEFVQHRRVLTKFEEIIVFMEENKERYLVFPTGIQFLYQRYQEMYLDMLTEFYDLYADTTQN